MKEIKSFTFYKNYYELLDNLHEKDKKKMLEIIVDYVFKNIEPKGLKGMNLAIWNNLKMPLDTSKNNSMRSIGKGAPTGNKNAVKKTNQKQTENKPKTNQTGNRKQTNNISNFLFLISYFKFNNNINNLLKEYLEVRIKNKYTITNNVINRLCNKLIQYSTNDNEKEEIILNAINGSWKDFYPLKKENKKPQWFDKKIELENATIEEQEEMENLLKEFRS